MVTVTKYIRLTEVDSKCVPGYAPISTEDHLEAYSPFIFDTQEAAEADLQDDIESRKQDMSDDINQDEDEDEDYFSDDWVHECEINENGDISIGAHTIITRAEIFRTYGVDDPLSSSTPSP